MNVMDIVMRVTRPTGEGQNKQTEHVERCHSRDDQPNRPQNLSVIAGCATPPQRIMSLLKNPAKPGNPGDREGPDEESSEGPGHFLSKSAHFRDVLNAAHSVNHASGAEEQQRFEKRVRHQMEDTRRHRLRRRTPGTCIPVG